tara:strand:- start:1120 stop:1497 length:378 start_codon:yes stop_codon:yes gene_type:complete
MVEKKYTKEHEWVKIENEFCYVGISEYAQDQLGDIVFIELPEKNKSFAAGDEAAVVESVKAASEIYSPLSGTVVGINEKLTSNPQIINNDPENEGWIWKMQLNNQNELSSLLEEEAYLNYLNEIS